MMKKDVKWTLGVLVVSLLIMTAVRVEPAFLRFQRRYSDVLFQMISYAGARHGQDCGYAAPMRRFIVENDGTLISYVGIGRCICNFEYDDFARKSLMQVVHERAVTTLSEEDYQHLYGLLELMAEMRDGERSGWLSMFRTRIFYDGYIYSSEAFPIARCEETGHLVHPFNDLYEKIGRLRPR